MPRSLVSVGAQASFVAASHRVVMPKAELVRALSRPEPPTRPAESACVEVSNSGFGRLSRPAHNPDQLAVAAWEVISPSQVAPGNEGKLRPAVAASTFRVTLMLGAPQPTKNDATSLAIVTHSQVALLQVP